MQGCRYLEALYPAIASFFMPWIIYSLHSTRAPDIPRKGPDNVSQKSSRITCIHLATAYSYTSPMKRARRDVAVEGRSTEVYARKQAFTRRLYRNYANRIPNSPRSAPTLRQPCREPKLVLTIFVLQNYIRQVFEPSLPSVGGERRTLEKTSRVTPESH